MKQEYLVGQRPWQGRHTWSHSGQVQPPGADGTGVSPWEDRTSLTNKEFLSKDLTFVGSLW